MSSGMRGDGFVVGAFFQFGGYHVIDREDDFGAEFGQKFFREIELVVFDERFADGLALGFQECVGHGAADQHLVDDLREIFDDLDLVRYLCAAEDGDGRARRIFCDHGQVLQLLIHEKTRGGLFHELNHADGGGVSAMGGAECIVDVDVAESGELFREAGIVGLFFGVIAEIFEKQHFAGFGQHGFDFGADAVGREFNGLAQKLFEPLRHGLHAHLGIRLAFGPAEVRGEDDARAVFEYVLNGGKRSADAFVAGDFLAAVRQRNVEVYPNEDAFPL